MTKVVEMWTNEYSLLEAMMDGLLHGTDRYVRIPCSSDIGIAVMDLENDDEVFIISARKAVLEVK